MLALELRRRHVATHTEGNHESHTGHGGDGIACWHTGTLRLAVLVDLAQRWSLDLLERGWRISSLIIVVIGMSTARSMSLTLAALHLLVATVSAMIALRDLELLHVRLEAVRRGQAKLMPISSTGEGA